MFSEVCIPLTTRCLHAPLLYIGGACVLRDHTNRICGLAATVYRREQGPRWFGRKLDSEYGGERSGRGFATSGLIRDPLAHGEGLELSTELPNRELGPYEGFLARGSNEDLGEACALLDTSIKKYWSHRRKFAYLYLAL